MPLRATRALGVLIAVSMVIAIAYGIASGGFLEEFRSLLEMPWGRVTLIDLTAGLVLAGAWIGWREASLLWALPWWIALLLTGNLALGIYVARVAWTATGMNDALLGRRA